MKKNTSKLTINETKFLKCILEKGNIADTEIAKKIGASKATVSRIRKKLETSIISEYIPVIELHKVGIDVFLVLTFQWNAFDDEELTTKTFSELKKDPKVIFLANGDGAISNTVMFMAFENLEKCHLYLKEFRHKYGKYFSQISTLLLPSTEIIKNDFTEVIMNILTTEANKNE